MTADSRPVYSNQAHVHKNLANTVKRHMASSHARPVAEHNARAFGQLLKQLGQKPRGLVLDSFCGTGQSTEILAARHPDHLVVGIDKSASRLARHAGATSKNYLLLQANCEDIWQLLRRENLTLDYHYLLYPNPWPKGKHLQRRIHGHASFPWLLELGGQLELRSNWQLYVEEFGMAMSLSGHPGFITQVSGAPPLTLFEQKYRDSGHALWAFMGRIQPPAGPAP